MNFLTIILVVLVTGDLDYPETRRANTVDTYHGQSVDDPYRWMEDLESAELKSWLASQKQLMRDFADRQPVRKQLRDRIKELSTTERFSLPNRVGDTIYYTRTAPSEVRPTLYAVSGDVERSIMKPDDFIHGEEDQLKTWSVSPDGRLLIYKTAIGQSRWGTLHVIDMESGELVDRIHSFQGNGSPVWGRDGKSFFYVRYDAPLPGQELTGAITGGRVVQHLVGTGERLLHITPQIPTNVFSPQVGRDKDTLFIMESNSKHKGTNLLTINLVSGEKRRVVATDANLTFVGASANKVRLFTDHSAGRGRIIELDLDRPQPEFWRELVGESGATIQSVTESGDYLVVRASRDADFHLSIYNLKGGNASQVDLPHAGWSWSLGGTPIEENGVYFSLNGLYTPGSSFYLDLEANRVTHFKSQSLPLDPNNYIMKQVFFKSADGTRVPMFIAHRKDIKPHPTSKVFMYGYGAYSWSAYPWFQAHWVAWMDLGGIYAMPGVRGGGEYGEAWHQAGIKTNKQKGIDDFIAAAEYLIEQGYTSKGGVVSNGGSASGVLAATAAMQRPDLFGAAVIEIPTLDLLRFDRDPAGKYRVAEYGTPTNAEQYKVLRKLSPVHNVVKGSCYPPTLIHVGSKDQVALPWHGYKFTAALQHGMDCDHAVLLRVSEGAGHALGLTPAQRIEATADQLAFLVKVLGMNVPQRIAAN
jgi:prolyl oligopeptidase